MFKFFRILLISTAAAVLAGSLSAQRDIGDVVISADIKTIGVSITGSPELVGPAQLAFKAHGRYRVVATGGSYAFAFTTVAPNQVQVVVTKRNASLVVERDGAAPKSTAAPAATAAGSVVLSRVVQGASLRNALFKAADQAVTASSGLKGFFASRLTFISEYSNKSEVYTGDLFFGEVRQITRDNAFAMTPRWSPDGGKIIYTSFKNGFPDIFLMDLNSLQRSTFVQYKGTNSGARFSPDGNMVAMILTAEGNPEIYVANARGRLGTTRRTRTPAVEASPCFSPDGSRIVYTSDAAGGPQLYIMPTSGGSSQRIVTNLSRYCAEPDWSRGDANKIAFTVGVGKGFQVAVLDLSGKTKPTIVSKAPVDGTQPAWMADGRHLIYTARAANSRVLYLLDTESGRTTRLSPAQMGQTSQASVWIP